MGWAEWPARLQRLAPGPLHDLLPAGSELWLDGGHNPAAARAIADFFRAYVPAGRPFHVVLGLLANKDAAGRPQGLSQPRRDPPRRSRSKATPTTPPPPSPRRRAKPVSMPCRRTTSTTRSGWIARHADREQPPIVLIMGSLYLAGAVLRKNDQPPG